MKAYSYLRFSNQKQLHGSSIQRQQEKIDRWLTQNPEYQLDTALRDLGISGFSGDNLKRTSALGGFLKKLEEGDIPSGSVLLIEKLDRLSRKKMMEVLTLIQSILSYGITIHILDDNTVLNSDSMNDLGSLMMVVVKAYLSNEESQKKADRISSSWNIKRKNATTTKMTSQCPPWLKPVTTKVNGRNVTTDWTVIESHAQTIRLIFGLAKEGNSISQILKHLSQEKIKPISGAKNWNGTFVSKLLSNRKTLGEHQPTKNRKPIGPPIPDYYPAVVTEEDFLLAQHQLKQHRSVRGPAKDDPWLLSGLLYHAVDKCGLTHSRGRYWSTNHRNGVDGASNLSLPRPALEAVVVMAVYELGTVTIKPAHSTTDIKQLRASYASRISVFESQLENATADTIPVILNSITSLRKKMAGLSEMPTEVAEVKDRDYSDKAGLRASLNSLVTKILVKPYKHKGQVGAYVQIKLVDGSTRYARLNAFKQRNTELAGLLNFYGNDVPMMVRSEYGVAAFQPLKETRKLVADGKVLVTTKPFGFSDIVKQEEEAIRSGRSS